MIYLVKKICTECNMKIELNDEHFGIDLACPNCDADISVPDVNKVAEEKKRLAKEIEDLKNDSKFTQTNTITMGRPGQTLKVQTDAQGANEGDLLKKERAVTAQLRKEEQVLNNKLKGLQAANMAMNAELGILKEQKKEFNKSLSTIKDLQKTLDDRNKEFEQLQAKLEKYSQLTKSLKEMTTTGQADVVSSTDVMAETVAVSSIGTDVIGKVNFDETLQVSMDAVKVRERQCSSCGIEYPYTAKFCPKCKTLNENYSD